MVDGKRKLEMPVSVRASWPKEARPSAKLTFVSLRQPKNAFSPTRRSAAGPSNACKPVRQNAKPPTSSSVAGSATSSTQENPLNPLRAIARQPSSTSYVRSGTHSASMTERSAVYSAFPSVPICGFTPSTSMRSSWLLAKAPGATPYVPTPTSSTRKEGASKMLASSSPRLPGKRRCANLSQLRNQPES